MPSILIIVEGEGDREAAPLLCRRLLGELHGAYDWSFVTHRRGSIANLKANNYAHFRRFLQAGYKEGMPILWMLDNDENDCARFLVTEFYEHVNSIGVQQPLAFCLWTREYETMFLYDPEFVATKLGIQKLSIPDSPENRRGAKELLSKQMPRGHGYKETVNQPALTAGISLERLKENYGSFQHFERALIWLTQRARPELYPLRA